jgi:hypothetical protein
MAATDPRLWKKNLLLGAVCLAGLAGIGYYLLRRDRVESPQSYWPERFQPVSLGGGGILKSPPPANDLLPTRDQLNQQFAESWKSQQLEHAGRADDLTIARRVSLALTGSAPSLAEIRALEKVPADTRLEWWVSHLLEDRRSSDYLAERLTRAFIGTENGPFIVYRRRRFVAWLSDQLHNNRPYDELVREMVAGQGLWTSNPAVNFITASGDPNMDNQPDEIRLAGRTARAFLGLRIDCLRCHDDRLGNVTLGNPGSEEPGKEAHFHQLAAFYSEASTLLSGVRDVEDQKHLYRHKYLNTADEVVVGPKVPYGDAIFSGHGSRREQLAHWLTHAENKPFARAIVNRVWALLYGRPLVTPIDDIPLEGEYPPGLELLAEDFVKHGYDLHRLVRLIVASQPFQLSSEADFEIDLKHDKAWAVFPLTRLRPEQVAQSVIQASSLDTIDGDAHIITQLTKFGQTNEFVQRYGDMGDDEFVDRGGTIPQRLLMMNGELVKDRTRENFIQNAATRIAALTPKTDKAIETAYLVTLTRLPSDEELQHFRQRFETGYQNDGRNARIRALEDLYWVLLNSTEFSWNH